MRFLLRWIDEQTGLVSATKRFLEHPLPTGTGWFHTLGALALFLFALQALTGVFLALYYVPSPTHAYESVRFISQRVALGNVVRGLHHYTTDALALIVGLHMLRAFLWGTYKKPRQMVWVVGVLLLVLTMGFTMTGVLLPWDQNGYWATVIRFSLAGSLPVVGPLMQKAILGGSNVGALTLTRFYGAHIFFLPGIVTLFIIFHIFHVRVKGITPPWRRVGDEENVEKPILFYPDHIVKTAVVCLVALMILLSLAAFKGAPLESPADPNSAYPAHTHWYFLYLFQFVHLFPGKWQFVGGVIIPTIALLLYVLLPYVDRNPERRLSRRPFSIFLAVSVFASVTYLGITGFHSTPHEPKLTAEEQRGQKVFLDLRCQACHGINGGGGTGGTDLAAGGKREAETVETVIRTPTKFNRRSIMPTTELPEEDMKSLVSFILSINQNSTLPTAPQAGPPKPSSHRQENYMLDHKFEVRKDPQACAECHEQKFCQSCHQKRLPDSHLHNWLPAHAGASEANEAFCKVCHDKSYCDSCHRKLLHGPGWFQVHVRSAKEHKKLCAECHTQSFCTECHTGAKPASHKQANFMAAHATLSKSSNCVQCHAKSFCSNCHTGAKPASHKRSNFMAAHGKLSMATRADCSTCHAKTFCSNCHRLDMPHPDDWMKRTRTLTITYPTVFPPVKSSKMAHSSHSMAANREAVCANCHVKQECATCHKMEIPHPSDFVRTHGKMSKKDATTCLNCHTQQNCMNCHETQIPHPKGWVKKHNVKGASFERNSFCMRCHTLNDCYQCHEVK
jgi:ubiquinol-cytochrome c reductase cytochrome b subunit